MHDLSLLVGILLVFKAVSGLKISMHESKLIPIGDVADVERKAEEFGCMVVKLLRTCLRLPLGAKYKSMSAWDPVIERFDESLAG